MKDYILPKTGATARISVLSVADLPDVLALQDATRAALPEDKKRFILPQGTAYFQNLVTGMTGCMIGIRTDCLLIAQMAVMGPMDLREAIAMRAITSNDITFHHAAMDDQVVIFKSMAAHPDWRGNDLAKNLIQFALDLPVTGAADHAFAQVSVGNRRSWEPFAQAGFGIVAGANDPTDGLPRFVFQKPTFDFDFADEISADDVDPVEDFAAIATLTQREGLIGCTDAATHGVNARLSFMRNRDTLSTLPTLARIKTSA